MTDDLAALFLREDLLTSTPLIPPVPGPSQGDARERELERQRQRNREKQARCRAKKRKAAEDAAEARLQAARLSLEDAEQRLQELRLTASAHQQRIVDACAALHGRAFEPPQLGDALAPGQQPHVEAFAAWAFGLEPAPPPDSPAPDPPPPRTRESTPTDAADSPLHPAPPPAPVWPQWPPLTDADGRGPCALFACVDPARRVYRVAERISRRRIGCTGVALEARVEAFRAAAAQRHGCDEASVLWLVESDRYPAITRNGGVRSVTDTLEAVAQLTTLCIATQLEVAFLLCITSRLEKLLTLQRETRPQAPPGDAASAPPRQPTRVGGPPAPGPLPPPDGPRCGASLRRTAEPTQTIDSATSEEALFFVPPVAAASAAVGGSAWASQLGATPPAAAALAADVACIADAMHTVFLEDCTVRPPGGSINARGRVSGSQSHVQDLQSARVIAEHVFSGIVRTYLPHTHPADVLRVARRLGENYNMRDAARRELAPLGLTTGGSAFACVVNVALRVMQDACRHVRHHPAVPTLPTARHEIEDRLASSYQQAAEAKLEFELCYHTCRLDRPDLELKISSGIMSVKSGPMKAFAFRLKCYQDMNLHSAQKLQLARLLAEYRARVALLDSEQSDAVRALELLPTAADIPLRDLELVYRAQSSPPPPLRSPLAALDALDAHAPSLEALLAAAARGAPAIPAAPGAGAFGPGDAARRGECGATAFGAVSVEPWRDDACAPLAWVDRLLGVSVEGTEAAARVVLMLREALRRRQVLRCRLNGLLRDSLTWKDLTLWGEMLPVVDRHGLCEMATADLRCDRMFGRATIGDV